MGQQERAVAASRLRDRRAAKDRVLSSVQPNAGVAAAYQKRLDRLIDEMQASLVYWLTAAYRENPPENLAADRSPASEIGKMMKRLARRWLGRFDDGSKELARYFAQDATKRSDAQLKAILKRAGFAVDFKMSRAANDAYQAVLAENVGLIKSIAQQHLDAVAGHVYRAVARGGDLGPLAKDLHEQFGVTKRRAAFIARDQSSKATAVITKARFTELGITQAVWRHSGAGRHPRPTHEANDGKVYTVSEGWVDPALNKSIWPGSEPNCRCTARPVIPERF